MLSSHSQSGDVVDKAMLREFRPGFRSWSCQWEEFGRSARFTGRVCQVCGLRGSATRKPASKQHQEPGKQQAQKGPSGTEEATSTRKKITDRNHVQLILNQLDRLEFGFFDHTIPFYTGCAGVSPDVLHVGTVKDTDKKA